MAPVRVDPSGGRGPTRKQARGRRWRTTSWGLHVPSSTDADDPEQRTVEAAELLYAGEAVTGWAALGWEGGRWFTGTSGDGSVLRPVPLVTARHVLQQPGIAISQEFLAADERRFVDGLVITSSLRSVCFEARFADTLTAAVVAVDMAAYSDLVTLDELAAYVAAQMAPTGIGLAREAVALGDENSWSPRETLMRLVWTRQGERPRPLCNVPVFDRWGRHVGTPDLLDPVAGVVGEYDSDLHLVGAQRTKDVRREGEFRSLGLEHVTMLGSDQTDYYTSFLSRLETAYANARYGAEGDSLWTIDPPRWWVDTTTVDARRHLSPHLRDRLLRHRRAA
ncbi:hypothetical protein [Nocardioides sp. GXQ0305]|uniref:hypothetical protein n=1 Tax=Nocardioides sp. GXQ0305 TaxID=3423912 RepID=UPI003D7E1D0A